MLPLAITFLATLYLYAPGLLFRWAVGLAVGKENLKQPPSKVEETTQAVLWITVPLALTILWIWCGGALKGSAVTSSLETVMDGLYSEPTFRLSPEHFYASLWAFTHANLQVLWRLYLMVGTYALFTYFVLKRTRHLFGTTFGRAMVRIALVTSPPLAEWATLLNGMFVPRDFEIHVDVLGKSGVLYQGQLAGYALESSGALRNLTLDKPRRFLREEYEEKHEAWPSTKTDAYWKDIPGNLFVIQGGEVANINFRYVRRADVLSSIDPTVLASLLKKE